MGPSSCSALLALLLFSSSLPHNTVPNFPDLKIKTRHVDEISTRFETLYLKGSRQRQEFVQNSPIKSTYVSITRCDQHRRISLNTDAKLFAETPIVKQHVSRDPEKRLRWQQGDGADVSITVDSVDTGERRQVGRFTARHVKVSIRTDAAPGANMHSMLEERDGWYIDLPGLGCQASSSPGGVGISFLTPAPSGRQDHIHFTQLGTAPTGFAIEETTVSTENDRSTIRRIELLEFADSPLEDSLFERPSGYSSARRTPRGGYDLNKPETIGNRIQVGWTDLTSSLRSLF